MEINPQSPSLGRKFRRHPNASLINFSHSPKEDTNIKLEKYTVITDDMLNKATTDTISTTPEISPDLQTRWAMMKLGISRTRQRLEITSHTKESPSLTTSSPSSDSQYSSSSEGGQGRRPGLKKRVQEKTHTEKMVKYPDDKYRTTVEVEERVKENYSFLQNEQKSKPDPMVLDFGTSQTKSYLDIGVSEKTPVTPSQQSSHSSSSSSSSDDETIDHSVPDLRAGVPRIKRRLNIRAPSPEPSSSPSSCSENESDAVGYKSIQSTHASNILTEDNSLITYKRSIIKASPLSSSSFTTSSRSQTKQTPTVADMLTVAQEGAGDRPLALVSGSRMSFSNTIQSRIEQSRSNTDLNLPREIRWTGVGHRLPDSSISKPRSAYAAFMSLPQASPARDFSRSTSAAEIMQDSGKSDVTLTHKYSSLGATSVSPLSSDASDKGGSSLSRTNETSGAVSEDKKENRGLGAIKNMAMDRRMWDMDDRRAGSLMYGIPRYRRRDITPPQDAPPPVPDTPLPDY
ncbi:endochitinase A-like [Melanotaenia boesemani]|uniref:endochitinase A-like n=1 Tax=Melanotaenia boesemani TaxID=1250792 RepID=UPI001C044B39|nr:endochitinase A-like [Melanotaenia boesemani]